jgi:hypothetical protein
MKQAAQQQITKHQRRKGKKAEYNKVKREEQ